MRIFALHQCADYAHIIYIYMWVQVRHVWYVLCLLQAGLGEVEAVWCL